MEDNRYYIPDLNEFYPGFEYQMLQDGLKIAPSIFEFSHLDSIFDIITYSDGSKIYRVPDNDTFKIGVKYLDQFDLEELEFRNIEAKELHIYAQKAVKYLNTTCLLCLNYKVQSKIMKLTVLVHGAEIPLFHGVIKNKSKLKEILEMIII